MKSASDQSVKARPGLFSSPHFWAICLIMVVITFIYYLDLVLPFNRWEIAWNITIYEFKYSIHGILYVIPLFYAAVVYWWRGTVVIWLFSVLLILPKIVYFSSNSFAVVINLVYLAIPLLVVLYITFQRFWRRKERQVLEDREAARQNYLSQIFKAQENERLHFARELHDSALQTLLVISTRAQTLSKFPQVAALSETKEIADWIQSTATSLSQELRRLTIALRPSVLDNLGFFAALRWLIAETEKEGIKASLKLVGEKRNLSPNMDINLFRIVQEALNNVRHHASATQVAVTMEFLADTIILTIHDNGRGFILAENSDLITDGKLGLIGMQQRVKFLDGEFALDSAIGEGTCIIIKFKG